MYSQIPRELVTCPLGSEEPTLETTGVEQRCINFPKI